MCTCTFTCLTVDSVFADIDECKLPTLHDCPPSAGCNNTLGSYQCICPQGHVDADPSNPGTSCKGWICPKIRYLLLAKPTKVLDNQTLASSVLLAEDRTWATTEPPATVGQTVNTHNSSPLFTVEEPRGSNTTDNSTTTAPSPPGPVPNGSSEVLTGSTPASTTESRPPTSACCKNLLHSISS